MIADFGQEGLFLSAIKYFPAKLKKTHLSLVDTTTILDITYLFRGDKGERW